MDSIEGITTKISDVSIKDISEFDNNHIIQIEYPMDLDPREDIFKYAVKNKWILIEMNTETANLETIFRKLTN